MTFDIKRITPGWWGAIAGAVAAGASLFPNGRLIGGAAAGAAMFLLAKKMTPCCDGCAAGQGCGDDVQSADAPPTFMTAPTAGSTSSSGAPCLTCDGAKPTATAPELGPMPTDGVADAPVVDTTFEPIAMFERVAISKTGLVAA